MDFSRENQSVYRNKFFSGINLFYGGIESLNIKIIYLWEKHSGNKIGLHFAFDDPLFKELHFFYKVFDPTSERLQTQIADFGPIVRDFISQKAIVHEF